MKKHSIKFLAILFVLAIFGLASCLKAQTPIVSPPTAKQAPTSVPNAKVDAQGNFTSIPKTSGYTDTGKTYTDLTTNKVHKVYQSTAGKLFYFRISQTSGKEYKQYLNPTL